MVTAGCSIARMIRAVMVASSWVIALCTETTT